MVEILKLSYYFKLHVCLSIRDSLRDFVHVSEEFLSFKKKSFAVSFLYSGILFLSFVGVRKYLRSLHISMHMNWLR